MSETKTKLEKLPKKDSTSKTLLGELNVMETFEAQNESTKQANIKSYRYQLKELKRLYTQLKITAVKELVDIKDWDKFIKKIADHDEFGRKKDFFELKLEDKEYHTKLAEYCDQYINPALIKDPQMKTLYKKKWALKAEFGATLTSLEALTEAQGRPSLFKKHLFAIYQLYQDAKAIGITAEELEGE